MKNLLAVGALALALAGCADLTTWTGLSAEQQTCIGTEAAKVAQDGTAAAEMVAAVEAACGVSAADTIAAAINAALEAE